MFESEAAIVEKLIICWTCIVVVVMFVAAMAFMVPRVDVSGFRKPSWQSPSPRGDTVQETSVGTRRKSTNN